MGEENIWGRKGFVGGKDLGRKTFGGENIWGMKTFGEGKDLWRKGFGGGKDLGEGRDCGKRERPVQSGPHAAGAADENLLNAASAAFTRASFSLSAPWLPHAGSIQTLIS